jgi:exopolyphosphatase/guanosine-5'-triphosphate,3'-diphosphate pyrophosphatase
VVADAHAAFDLAEQVVPLRSAASLVGVAGTVTTVAALAHDLPAYDAERIHLSVVSAEDVAAVTDRLIHMTHDERAALAVMHPGRVDVIASGALVLRTLVERCGVPEIIASERDILDGIAFSLAEPSAASASSGSARTAGTGKVVPPAAAAYAEPAERG